MCSVISLNSSVVDTCIEKSPTQLQIQEGFIVQDKHVLLMLFINFPKFELSLEGLHLFILLIMNNQMRDKSQVNIKFQTCM